MNGAQRPLKYCKCICQVSVSNPDSTIADQYSVLTKGQYICISLKEHIHSASYNVTYTAQQTHHTVSWVAFSFQPGFWTWCRFIQEVSPIILKALVLTNL